MAEEIDKEDIITKVLTLWAIEGIGSLPFVIDDLAQRNEIPQSKIYSIINEAKISIKIDRVNGKNSITFSYR